ncbi:MAG TPA: hypothetical protein VIY48_11400, partial [Candidatus Paceibacterota bacterium]
IEYDLPSLRQAFPSRILDCLKVVLNVVGLFIEPKPDIFRFSVVCSWKSGSQRILIPEFRLALDSMQERLDIHLPDFEEMPHISGASF